MAAEDDFKLEEIRNEKIHRLNLLKKRQAIEGFRTPPEIIIEIARTERELGIVESAITHPADASMAEEMGAGGRFLALDRKLDRVEERAQERLDRFEQRIEASIARVQSSFNQRMDRMEEHADDRFQIQEKKHEQGAAFYRSRLALALTGVAIALAFVVILSIVVAAIVGRLL